MDAAKFQRMMAVFEEAVDAPTDRQPDLLDSRCGDDADLKAGVAALLEQARRADAAVRTGAGLMRLAREAAGDPGGTSHGIGDGLPLLAGQYRILRVIGEGGMGTVYEAEQLRPRRTVALKAIRGRAASRAMLRRFQREAQILARMQHPGIAQIYEAGADNDDPDQAYFAMELIRGRPLTEHAAAGSLDLNQRLDLMAGVCDAVHHAHQRGVIHRDLKPSNILVDEQGQPKILDFGVALASDADPVSETMRTAAGQLVGTLPYMSPEQVGADADGVDVRTDVYALGVLLYQLLSGRLPVEVQNKPVPEAARMIREVKPTRLGRLDPALRGDAETIAARALEKDKERRYQSAADLGQELRRCIRGEPIEARRDSAMYLLRKRLARHRVVVAAGSAAALGITAFAVYAGVQAARYRTLAGSEHAAKVAAVTAQGVAEQEHARADRDAAALRDSLYVSRIGFAQAAYSGGDAERMRRVLAECPPEQRGWEWSYLNRLADRSVRTARCFEPGLMGRWYTPSHGRVFAWRADGGVVVLSAADGATVARFDTHRLLTSLSESPDGRTLAAGDNAGTVVLYDSPSGVAGASWTAHRHSVVTAQFSADSRTLLTAGPDGVALWDLPSARALRRIAPPSGDDITFAALSPDGALIACAGHAGPISLWGEADDQPVRVVHGHEGPVLTGVFSADGRLFATGSEDRTMRVWDVESGRQVSVVRGHANKVFAVALSPDGRLAVSGGTEAVLRVSDPATGRELQRLLGHEATITGISFIADGSGLISSGRDGTIRWWADLADQDVPRMDLGVGSVRVVRYTPDGSGLVFGAERGAGLLVRVAGRDGTFREGQRLDALVASLAFAPDGRTMYTGERSGLIVRRGALTGEAVASLTGHRGEVQALACSPDGGRLASASADGTLRVWDVAAAREERQLRGDGVRVGAVLWDGAEIISGSWDGTIRVWDGASGETIRLVRSTPGAITGMCLAGGEASVLVASGADEDCSVWDRRTLERIGTLKGHQGPVHCIAASPDGTRVATGGFDNTVRVWEPRSGAELVALRAHLWSVDSVAFSPDGRTLVSAGSEGALRLWESAPDR